MTRARTVRRAVAGSIAAVTAAPQLAAAKAKASAGGVLPSVRPNTRAPGAAQLSTLVGDLLLYVLIACGVGALVGLAAWAATTHSGHYAAAGRSKMGFLSALAGAMLAG